MVVSSSPVERHLTFLFRLRNRAPGPEIVVWGESKRPPPKPIGRVGGLRPPPFPPPTFSNGLAVGGGAVQTPQINDFGPDFLPPGPEFGPGVGNPALGAGIPHPG